MTPTEWGDIANQGIAATMFITFISGLLRGWWVLGRELDSMREDRDYWRGAADRVAGMAETAIDTPLQQQRGGLRERRQ